MRASVGGTLLPCDAATTPRSCAPPPFSTLEPRLAQWRYVPCQHQATSRLTLTYIEGGEVGRLQGLCLSRLWCAEQKRSAGVNNKAIAPESDPGISSFTPLVSSCVCLCGLADRVSLQSRDRASTDIPLLRRAASRWWHRRHPRVPQDGGGASLEQGGDGRVDGCEKFPIRIWSARALH